MRWMRIWASTFRIGKNMIFFINWNVEVLSIHIDGDVLQGNFFLPME